MTYFGMADPPRSGGADSTSASPRTIGRAGTEVKTPAVW
jgi:hypothetical protein